ncbi:hypothetical protein D3C86_2134520 [compost metagenome]
MSRTTRRKRYGDSGVERDGQPPDLGIHLAFEFAIEVTRRDRRAREQEAERLAKGVIDPDDTPTKPRPRRLWQYWKGW